MARLIHRFTILPVRMKPLNTELWRTTAAPVCKQRSFGSSTFTGGSTLPGNGMPGIEPGTCNLIALLLFLTELHSDAAFNGWMVGTHPGWISQMNRQELNLRFLQEDHHIGVPFLSVTVHHLFYCIGAAGEPVSSIQTPCRTTDRV